MGPSRLRPKSEGMRLTASVVAAANGDPDRWRTNAATVRRARWSPHADRALLTKMAT